MQFLFLEFFAFDCLRFYWPPSVLVPFLFLPCFFCLVAFIQYLLARFFAWLGAVSFFVRIGCLVGAFTLLALLFYCLRVCVFLLGVQHIYICLTGIQTLCLLA